LPLKDQDEKITGTITIMRDVTNEEELRKLQQKTLFFLDFTSSGVLAVDKNLKVTIFNTAAESITGVKRTDALGYHITEAFNTYEAENYPVIETLLTGEEFHNYDVSFYLNGQVRTLLFDTARIIDEDGQITGAMGTFKDISERKRIEEELKRTVFAYSKEKSFMRSMLNNLQVAIFTFDRNLHPTYMNSNAEELTGYRIGELVKMNHSHGVTALNKIFGRAGQNLVSEVLRTGEPVAGEQKHIVSRNGGAVPVSLDIHPLHNSLRENNGVMVIARDLSEKLQHEHLMYLSRCILNSLNSAVVAIDSEYRLIVINPPAEALLGFKSDEVLGHNVDEVLGRIFTGGNICKRTLDTGCGIKLEEITAHIRGEDVMLLVNSDVVRDKDNNILGAVAIFHDITELRRTQRAVQERERLAIIGQMAAGMAHEIKNPLTAVRGFAQLIKEKSPEDHTLSSYVGIMIEEIDRASGVINDFLQLARPKQPVLEKQAINDLIEEIVAIVEPHAFLKRISVEFSGSGEIPACLLDRSQIKQVILNMCQNSIESMPDGGRLKISTGYSPADNHLCIEISDTGCGIPEDHLDKLGVPFFTSKASGTGLGLSISYSIIGAHNGRVEAESKEGQGTVFRVYLPC
ncbi:MAG: PAS domain S-box protein, partial [Firmicutes bacterium]|nr:PAS domain S-box protein [Bacillota bacterium]